VTKITKVSKETVGKNAYISQSPFQTLFFAGQYRNKKKGCPISTEHPLVLGK